MISTKKFIRCFTNVNIIWTFIIITFVFNFISVYTEFLMPTSKPDSKIGAQNIGVNDVAPEVFKRHILNDLKPLGEENLVNPEALAKDDGAVAERSAAAGKGNAFKMRRFTNDSNNSYRKNYRIHEPRPLTCENCFPTYFKFDSADVCNSTGRPDQVDILILITTSYDHIRERMVLRNTWLTRTRQNRAKVRYVFLLGQSKSVSYSNRIKAEELQYHDIVTANFTDTYDNLTLKTLAGFKWAQSYCPQANMILKTDDDVYVNIPGLIAFTEKYSRSIDKHIFGACWKRAPIRDKTSKYYVDEFTYPFATYPIICSGTAYLLSSKLVSKVISISPNVPFFRLEDVYISLCMKQLGVTPKRHTEFVSSSFRKSFSLCLCKSNSIVTAHVNDPDRITEIWNLKCPDKAHLRHSMKK